MPNSTRKPTKTASSVRFVFGKRTNTVTDIAIQNPATNLPLFSLTIARKKAVQHPFFSEENTGR